MLPEYPKFKALTVNDLDKISKHLKDHSSSICELAPANMIIWKEFDKPKYTIINHNLCILVSPPNEPPFFFEPIGGHKLNETVDLCLKHSGKLGRISEAFLFKFDHDKYKISCSRDQFDYIYLTRTLAELKGRSFDGKRNHIKKFQQRHPDYKYVPLKREHKKEALALFEEWYALRKETRYFSKLAYSSQKSSVGKSFDYFNKLDLAGGALYFENKMKGFVLGSPLNPETISIHFMYGHPGTRGSSQILLWEAANRTFRKAKYLNLEQDLGIPGLRKSKLSNQPFRLEKKYEITQRAAAV